MPPASAIVPRSRRRRASSLRVFWEFIEAERNNVLKAYEVGARLNVIVRPGPAILSFSDSIAPFQKSDATSYEPFMRSGFYGGRGRLARAIGVQRRG